MPACPSAEQIAQYQRDGCLDVFEREQGGAFGRDEYGNFDLEPRRAAVVERYFDSNKLLTMRRRSGNVGI